MRFIFKSFIFILIFFILSETTSFIYYKYLSNDQNNLKNYKKKKEGNLNYFFSREIGLVLPKPGINIIHYTGEFVDNFRTKDILFKGIGFFDDGIDNKKIKAVAIGDSFTRGVGSIDNIENGWVEIVEKKSPNTDIINLGNLGIGIIDQVYGYNKIKKFINHDLVIYNFFSGGDYLDNLDDKNYNEFLNKNMNTFSDKKIQEIVNDLQIRHGYKFYLEYLSETKKPFYSIYFFLKIIDKLIIAGYLPGKKFKYNIPLEELRTYAVEDNINDLLKYNKIKINCKYKYCFREDSLLENINYRDIIINHSAKKINELYKNVTDENKEFLLIIHPSSRNLYPNITSVNYNDIDQELTNKLDKRIKNINLIDLILKSHNDLKKKDLKIYYKYDGHLTPEGYKIISNFIVKKIN